MRAIGVLAILALCGVSCSQADSPGQSAPESVVPSRTLDCENCFMLFALDRYLALPTRYEVRRSASDGCVAFTAPFSVPSRDLGNSQFAERLRTDSGLIRYCDRSVLDRDVAEIVGKVGPGDTRKDGEVSVRSWSPADMKTPFTATYFAWKDEGLLIFDVDRDFAERIWREGIR